MVAFPGAAAQRGAGLSGTSRANAPPAGGASGIGAQWQQALRWVPVTGFVVALAALGVVPAAAAQPPGDAAANLAGDGKLESALALLDTWVADNPDDPRMFPVLLQVVTAAPRKLTVDAVVERYRGRLATDQIAVLRAAPADLAELSGGVVQALRALELSGIADAPKRRAALMLELGEVTLDTVPDGMPIVHAGLARSGEGLGQARLEPSLRAAFQGSDTQADGGAVGAVAGYGLVSLLAANGRAAEAAAILEQMRSRFPRSPEYALAAAELNAGAGLPRVVAFPSPAMLLGALVASCLPPCPPPAAVLLAGPVERGETQTVPTATPDTGLMAALAAPPEAEPAAVVAAPAAKPVVDLMVAPTVEPAVVVTRAAEPAVAVVTPEPRPAVAAPAAKSVAVVVTRAAEPAVAVAKPAAKPALVVTIPVERGTGSAATPVPAQAAATPAVSLVAVEPSPPAAPSAVTDPPVRVSSRPARPTVVATGSIAGTISKRLSALLGATTTTPPPATIAGSPPGRAATGGGPVVRVSSRPDPAAFIVQTGAYRDADNALELEHQLIEAGFPAVARSYRVAGGGIVHRVAVGGNMTQTKAEQLLARIRDLGFSGIIARRDGVSYLPPPPPMR
jgi:hypothetical protein